MYVEDIISKLNKRVIRVNNTDYYTKQAVVDALHKLSETCISWSVDDFRQIAIDHSDENTWSEYYNEDNFPMALEEMIRKHDAENGITWDTVHYYLETYCRIKTYKPYYK